MQNHNYFCVNLTEQADFGINPAIACGSLRNYAVFVPSYPWDEYHLHQKMAGGLKDMTFKKHHVVIIIRDPIPQRPVYECRINQ